jgi:antitoxin MazE
MKVVKWGNSLAIRLPAALVEAMGWKEGDDININAHDPNAPRKPVDEAFKARMNAYRDRLPPDIKFAWDEDDTLPE